MKRDPSSDQAPLIQPASAKARVLVLVLRIMAGMPDRWRLGLGAITAWFACRIARRRMQIVQRNLELCFPNLTQRQRNKMAAQHMRALVQTFLDRGVFWFGSPQQIRQLVSVSGHSRIAEMLNQHGAVMLLAPHFIGLDAAATRLTLDGPAGATIYSPQRDPEIDALVRAGRARFNQVHLVNRKEGIRPLIRLIQQRIPIYYLPDMDFGRQGAVFVPFFGIPASTQTATAQLARKFNMPVLPVLCFWDPSTGHYRVEVRAPLEDFPGSDDLTTATARLNRHIESWVREYPVQYYWVHRRFKTRPPGEPKLY